MSNFAMGSCAKCLGVIYSMCWYINEKTYHPECIPPGSNVVTPSIVRLDLEARIGRLRRALQHTKDSAFYGFALSTLEPGDL